MRRSAIIGLVLAALAIFGGAFGIGYAVSHARVVTNTLARARRTANTTREGIMRVPLRWKWLIPATAACALAVSSATAASASVHLSQHWAGYVAEPKSGSTTKSFKDAQAVFTVPGVDFGCGAPSQYQETYVYQLTALGGLTEGPYVAAGVDEICDPEGNNVYYAATWDTYRSGGTCYERGPNDQVEVYPGDVISASTYYNTVTKQVVYTVVDKTTGQYIQFDESDCGNFTTSAEVATYGNIPPQGTADFGKISFTHVQVIGAHEPRQPITSTAWKTIEFAQKGPVTGKVDVQPGPVTTSNGASAFTNTWLNQN